MDLAYVDNTMLVDDAQGKEGVPMAVFAEILTVRESQGAHLPGSGKEVEPLSSIMTVCVVRAIEHHTCDGHSLVGGDNCLPDR